MKKKAEEYFRGKENYNCAQAIMKVFCHYCNHEDIEEYKKIGLGKAEGGLCGAVYASKKLLKNAGKEESLEKLFTESAGSTKCRDILKLKKLTCKQCVKLTGDFLEEHL